MAAEVFPESKPDRREFPNIPRGGATRRLSGERFLGKITVEVYDTGEASDIKFTTESRDLSASGMLLSITEGAKEVKVGDELFLRFSIPPGVMPEGFESKVAVAARVVRMDLESGEVGLQFAENLTNLLRRRQWRWFERTGVILIMLTVAAIAFMRVDSFLFFLFDVPVFLYGICASLFLVSRFFFSLLYRNVKVLPGYTPTVTIVIPCFNEREFITRTIRCALDQNYPEDKLAVIVVDDGSTDGSAERIREYKERVTPMLRGDRLKIILNEKNSGKRHVLAQGTREATSDLVVFVDSDSFLESEAIRQLVQPFRDAKIGAVCGRCDVENKWTNYITKMQAVRYYIAFQVFKGAESVFDAVTCLSGPLSCYRRTLVLRHLDDWLHQTFLGRAATFGDDRSLTNYILAHHRVLYQHNAVCSTIVPSNMKQFLFQQMRWKRSWFRETLRASTFMWRTEPFMALSFFAGFLFPVLAPAVVIRSFLFIPVVYGYFPWAFLGGIVGMGMLMSATYLVLRRSGLWIYGGFFCLFYLAVLLWQMPIAVATFWKSEWGTRETEADMRRKKKKLAAG